MKSLPYFRWYPADADTDEHFRAMNDMELGFFFRCLNHSWLNNGIPEESNELARTFKVRRSYLDKIWPRVGRCFEPSKLFPGRLVNPRQEKERSHAIQKSESAAKSVGTRYERTYERRTNDLPRAQARAESVSVSSGVVLSSSSGESSVAEDSPLPSREKENSLVLVTEPAPLANSRPNSFQVYIALFHIGGRGPSEPDCDEAWEIWKNLSLAERIAARDHAHDLVQATEPRYIPLPVNHLRKKQWTRSDVRMIPLPKNPSRVELNQREAERRFDEFLDKRNTL